MLSTPVQDNSRTKDIWPKYSWMIDVESTVNVSTNPQFQSQSRLIFLELITTRTHKHAIIKQWICPEQIHYKQGLNKNTSLDSCTYFL